VTHPLKRTPENGAMAKAIKGEALPSLLPSIPFPFLFSKTPEPVPGKKTKKDEKDGQSPEAI